MCRFGRKSTPQSSPLSYQIPISSGNICIQKKHILALQFTSKREATHILIIKHLVQISEFCALTTHKPVWSFVSSYQDFSLFPRYILTKKLIITRERLHWQRRESSLLNNIQHSLLKLRLLRIIGVRAAGRWLSLAWVTDQDMENYWLWTCEITRSDNFKWGADRSAGGTVRNGQIPHTV